MLNLDLPPAVKSFAQREFVGEQPKWAHQPPPWSAFWAASALLLFAVPWTTFAVFWEGMAIQNYLVGKGRGWGGIGMILWGIPFVLVGLGMTSAPFWAWRQAKNSMWVLTNKRLAIVTAGVRGAVTVKSIMASDILSIERTETDHGIGSLKLVYQSTRDSDGDVKERSDTIYGIAEVRDVEAMIRELKAASRGVA